MALKYGLGLYARKEETKEEFTKRYDEEIKPDEKLTEFYHGTLCWMMMGADIGMITKESIPVLINRLDVVKSAWMKEIEKRFKLKIDKLLEKYFLGYTTNVRTLSTADFIKKRARILKNQLKQFTDKQIEGSEEKQYD